MFSSVRGNVVPLSDICEIVKGEQINGEFFTDKGKYYVMNGGTAPSGYYDKYNVEAGTISISEGGNSCGFVIFNTKQFWSGGHCYSLKNISINADENYLFHYLKSKENAIMKLRIGSGLPNIQKKDLAAFQVVLPPSQIQKTITSTLSTLVSKLQLEQSLENALQHRKTYLLSQMFI